MFSRNRNTRNERNCHPSYDPCISSGSEVDCQGGTGNGPRFTRRGQTYEVTGYDEWDLDSDGDGLGCELRGR